MDQPSATAGKDEPLWQEYQQIKDMVRVRLAEMDDPGKCAALLGDDCELPGGSEEQAEYQGTTAVFDCGFTPGIDGHLEGETPQSSWSLLLLDLAKSAVALEQAARSAGYPEKVWLAKLRTHEREGVAFARELQAEQAIGDPGQLPEGADVGTDAIEGYTVVDLAAVVDKDMAQYRQEHDPSLPELVSTEGCGAGEFPVVIRTDPKGVRVRLITEFLSTLCKRTERPLEGDGCPYWFEAPADRALGLAGLYRYRATWSDGAETSGTVDVDRLHNEESDVAELWIVRR